jgi:hypothetical protein
LNSVSRYRHFLTCLLLDYGHSIFQNLENSRTPVTILADYRTLWLDLCDLATQTGCTFCYTYGFYLTHQFFLLALSTYATLSDTMAGTLGNNILVATCVFVAGFMILAMCEGADDVVLKVSAGTTNCHVISHRARDSH